MDALATLADLPGPWRDPSSPAGVIPSFLEAELSLIEFRRLALPAQECKMDAETQTVISGGVRQLEPPGLAIWHCDFCIQRFLSQAELLKHILSHASSSLSKRVKVKAVKIPVKARVPKIVLDSVKSRREIQCSVCLDVHTGLAFFNCPVLPDVQAGRRLLSTGTCKLCLRRLSTHKVAETCWMVLDGNKQSRNVLCNKHGKRHYRLCRTCHDDNVLQRLKGMQDVSVNGRPSRRTTHSVPAKDPVLGRAAMEQGGLATAEPCVKYGLPSPSHCKVKQDVLSANVLATGPPLKGGPGRGGDLGWTGQVEKNSVRVQPTPVEKCISRSRLTECSSVRPRRPESPDGIDALRASIRPRRAETPEGLSAPRESVQPPFFDSPLEKSLRDFPLKLSPPVRTPASATAVTNSSLPYIGPQPAHQAEAFGRQEILTGIPCNRPAEASNCPAEVSNCPAEVSNRSAEAPSCQETPIRVSYERPAASEIPNLRYTPSTILVRDSGHQDIKAPLLKDRSPAQQRCLGYLCKHSSIDCYTCSVKCEMPAENPFYPTCICEKQLCPLCDKIACNVSLCNPLTYQLREDLLIRDDHRYYSRENPDYNYLWAGTCTHRCTRGDRCLLCCPVFDCVPYHRRVDYTPSSVFTPSTQSSIVYSPQ